MNRLGRAVCCAAFGVASVMGTMSAVLADDDDVPVVIRANGERDCHRLIASGNPDYPPYLWPSPDGREILVGAAADFVERLGEMAGFEVIVADVGNWGRVQQQMREGAIDMIAGAFFTLPRVQYMDYLYPAFLGTRSVVLSLKTSPLDYGKWADLEGLNGLTVINNSFGQQFDDFAMSNLAIQQVPSLEQGMRMLERGRADYMIYEEFPARAFAARHKIDGLRAFSNPISSENLYVTLSHRSPCNTPEIRARLSTALFNLVSGGAINEMLTKNILRWGTETN